MTRTIIAVLVTSAFALSPAHAQDAVSVTLERTGSWDLSYDDTSCDLVGVFGEGDQKVFAKFTRYAPGELFDLWLFGSQLTPPGSIKSIKVDFGPTENPREVFSFMFGKLGQLQKLGLGSHRLDDLFSLEPDAIPPKIPAEEIKRVETLTVYIDSRIIHLKLGSMAPPMEALGKCMEGLVRNWGYDPAEVASLSKQAVPLKSQGYWVTSADYPRKEFYQHTEGIVRFRLDIDRQGRTTACHIVAATETPGLNETTCKLLLKRARFSPALDTAGNPVPTFWVNSVQWVLPGTATAQRRLPAQRQRYSPEDQQSRYDQPHADRFAEQ